MNFLYSGNQFGRITGPPRRLDLGQRFAAGLLDRVHDLTELDDRQSLGRVPGRMTQNPGAHAERSPSDGPNLIALAMNGWADGEPAWWLNLQAHPEAEVKFLLLIQLIQ